ncbi:hypothetical protein U0070_015302 [Myodes glareolus]|uniref:Uncharacterized protein n=1 Tax=Myodes glareolus TaxID=447135 RepID=A0AAW0K017_MYOGA
MESAKETLLKTWFPEVQNIYYQGNKKKQLPTGDSSAKLDSFFNCAATLMTLQLQDLTLVSMQDFTNLIAQPQRGNRHKIAVPTSQQRVYPQTRYTRVLKG